MFGTRFLIILSNYETNGRPMDESVWLISPFSLELFLSRLL